MPARLIEQPAKLATPFTAVTELDVQARAAPGVPVPLVRAREIWSLLPAMGFPPESSTVTWGWPVKALPPAALVGSKVNASCEAVPALMEKVLLVPVMKSVESVATSW